MFITNSESSIGFEPHPRAFALGEQIERTCWEGYFPVIVELVINNARTALMVKHGNRIVHTETYED